MLFRSDGKDGRYRRCADGMNASVLLNYHYPDGTDGRYRRCADGMDASVLLSFHYPDGTDGHCHRCADGMNASVLLSFHYPDGTGGRGLHRIGGGRKGVPHHRDCGVNLIYGDLMNYGPDVLMMKTTCPYPLRVF